MLSGHISLVTGSSRGIGRAIALALARAGSDVCVTWVNRRDDGERVADEIRALGRNALAVRLDVSQRSDVESVVQKVIERFGSLDILVNNAGILQQKPFGEITDRDWDEMVAVNMRGTFLCSQAVLPLMQERQRGVIVNLASSGGQLGGTLAFHYSATKAAIICMTKSLARLGAPHVRVNCVSPGLIDTEMTQQEIASPEGKAKIQTILLQRAGRAEEVADTVVFLASDGGAYITGQTIGINGGLYLS